LTKPAISTIRRIGPALFYGLYNAHSLSNRSSLTGILASLGLMVQKGMFSAGTFRLVIMLKVLLLPILAIPNKPNLRDVPGLPSLTLLSGATWAKAALVVLLIMLVINCDNNFGC
jgi:hypothetical protein